MSSIDGKEHGDIWNECRVDPETDSFVFVNSFEQELNAENTNYQDEHGATAEPSPVDDQKKRTEETAKEDPFMVRNEFEPQSISCLTESYIDKMDSAKMKEILRKHALRNGKKKSLKPVEPAFGLASEEDIAKLPIREMKKILNENSVNTDKCCEKIELVQKLTQLWNDLNKTMGEIPEAERCLICTDSRINCVFMECGHQAACSECAHMVKDCPLCRMYVTRVVRTYRP